MGLRRNVTLFFLGIIFLLEFHPFALTVEGGVPKNNVIVEVPKSEEHKTSGIRIVGDEFMLNGQPLHIISGSVHYFRMPAVYWRDRLRKLKAAGFNSVATYVEWSYHEPEERQYDFSGDRDVAQFVRIAAEEGLHVLLRPGPYICAERDLGGLPYWLLGKYPKIHLRSTDKDFMSETRIWMAKLFERLTPLLVGNGGPIILVQVENEYGSFGKSMPYKEQLRDIMLQHVGTNALLYTTDGTTDYMIRSGAVSGALTTIDFGVHSKVKDIFYSLRKFMPHGPLMNSEFYPGWLTHWGENIQTVSKKAVVEALQDMLDNKVNVNMYMFFGGTNFEFSSGANFVSNQYLADLTSYDYDAPLSEAGDPTSKYYAIRDLMKKYKPELNNTVPPVPAPKSAYGTVTVNYKINLLTPEGRLKLGKKYDDASGDSLPTFEKLRQRAGFLLYETRLLGKTNGILEIAKPRDRVYVYVDQKLQGIISRMNSYNTLQLKSEPNSLLSLLVENQGRINYGSHLHDYKGILGNVKYEGSALTGTWMMTGFPLENVEVKEASQNQWNTTMGPVLYEGHFTLPEGTTPLDTFLDTTGWEKGYVWVNGNNLGRYWPVAGPQATLYTPGCWLKAAPAVNTIQILELEKPPSNLAMTFIDYPILNRTGTLDAIDPEVLIFGT